MFYFIALIFVYPIVVAMWIDSWKKSNKIIVETDKNRWTFYVTGVPVQEEINSLYNLHADSKKLLESVFKKLFFLKCLVLLILSGFAINGLIQINQRYWSDTTDFVLLMVSVCSVIFTLLIFYRLIQCLQIIHFITQRHWCIIGEHHNNHYYYSAYRHEKSIYTPLLAIVFRY